VVGVEESLVDAYCSPSPRTKDQLRIGVPIDSRDDVAKALKEDDDNRD